MPKYIRYKTAVESSMYQEIMHDAAERLIAAGSFSKHRVLVSTGYDIVSDSIQWEHVVRMIGDMHGVELIGVTALYFKKHDEERMSVAELRRVKPKQFVAGTAGSKRTAGFISVDDRHEDLVQVKLAHQANSGNGVKEKMNKVLKGATTSPDSDKALLVEMSEFKPGHAGWIDQVTDQSTKDG